MAGTLWMEEEVGGVWLLRRVSGQSWLFLDVLQACRKGSSRNVFRVGNGGSCRLCLSTVPRGQGCDPGGSCSGAPVGSAPAGDLKAVVISVPAAEAARAL